MLQQRATRFTGIQHQPQSTLQAFLADEIIQHLRAEISFISINL